ncbi:hypothetical protein [Photobacterium kishitanii]|uniref:hypothetical protein n=1 Tax=Photobacterium kishitanii TaxID=318456 RepID=UPI000D165DBD|nr:hypothetical protein [Photobacterium kishitanii]PSU21371.1 hypothetical protein CTM84_09885 [Photobacterium kishitanii]
MTIYNNVIIPDGNTSPVLTGCKMDQVNFVVQVTSPEVNYGNIQEAFLNNKVLTLAAIEFIKQLLSDHYEGRSTESVLNVIASLFHTAVLNDSDRSSIIACKLLIGEVVSSEEKHRILTEVGKLSDSSLSTEYEDCLCAGAIMILSERGDEERKKVLLKQSSGELSKQAYICTLKIPLTDITSLPFPLNDCGISTLKLILDKLFSCNNIEFASIVLDMLIKCDYSYDYKKETLLLECLELNSFTGTDYFLLEKSKKTHLDNIILKIVDYLEIHGCENNRDGLFFIAVQLATYTQVDNDRLLSLLEKHQQELASVNHVQGIDLRKIVSVSEQDAYELLIKKSTAIELANRILKNTKDDRISSIVHLERFIQIAKPELIKSTYKEVKLIEQTPGVICATLMFLAVTCDHLEKGVGRSDILSLINKIEKEDLFIGFVSALSKTLKEKDLHDLSLMLFKSRLNEYKNPWISHVYIHYLNLLLDTEQYYDLDTRLGLIDGDDNELLPIVLLKARVAIAREHYDDAYVYFQKLLNNPLGNDNYCLRYVWMNLIYICKQQKKDYLDLINTIEYDVLDEPKDTNTWHLLSEIATNFENLNIAFTLGDIADKVLGWFIVEPEKYSMNIFNFIMQLPKDALSSVESTNAVFTEAICYSKNGRKEIRLVCSDDLLCNSQGTYLTPSTSKLANTQCGGSLLNGGLVVVSEKLPPLSGAYRIASDLMDMNNNVPFWKGNVDSDPNKVYQSLIDFIESIDIHKEQREKTLASDLPLHIKYIYMRDTNNFSMALRGYLSSKVANFFSTSSDYPEIKINNKDIVLDEFGFALLVVMGLQDQLRDSKLHITEGTKRSIEGWLPVDRSITVYFDEESDYFRYSEQPAINTEENLVSSVRFLLDRCEVHDDKTSDMPLITILLGHKLLSDNTKASISLASAKEYGYFTLEPLMLKILTAKDFNCCPLAFLNSFEFVHNNVNTVNTSEHIIRFSKQNNYLGLPDKCIFLASQSDNRDIIETVISYFNHDDGKMIEFLKELFLQSCLKSYGSDLGKDFFKYIEVELIKILIEKNNDLSKKKSVIFSIFDRQNLLGNNFLEQGESIIYDSNNWKKYKANCYFNYDIFLHSIDRVMQGLEEMQLPIDDIFDI